MTFARYILDPSNPSVPRAIVAGIARCDYWWSLWHRRELAHLALAESTDLHHQPALAERLADAQLSLRNHYDICDQCRAWLDAISSELPASSSAPSPISSFDIGEG